MIAKWIKELDDRLIKELSAFTDNRIAVRCAYGWHDDSGNWFRSYGNEIWKFAENGPIQKRVSSINDASHQGSRTPVSLVAGKTPYDHPDWHV